MTERLAPVYDRRVERLAPVHGERWLDVATGTGGVALRAARSLEDESPEALFDFMAAANPPTVVFLETLAPERREAYRRALIAYWRGFLDEKGRVREPNPCVLVIRTRKEPPS